MTVSVSVGPPSAILSGTPVDQWTPERVADAVLIDKSTARVSTGQRVALNDVQLAEKVPRAGGDPEIAFVYEHRAQVTKRRRQNSGLHPPTPKS